MERKIPVRDGQVLVVGLLNAQQEKEALRIQGLHYAPENLGWPLRTYGFGVWVKGYRWMTGTFGLEVVDRLDDIPHALDLNSESFARLIAAGFEPKIPMVVPIRAAFDRNLYARKDLYTVLRGAQLQFATSINAELQAGSNYLPHRIPDRLRDRFGYEFLQLPTTWSPWGDPESWAVTWADASRFGEIIAKSEQLNRENRISVAFARGSSDLELRHWRLHLRKSRARFS